MRIGIFGGTFDPPHIGHLILAAEAVYQLSLDHLLWMITETPPHKLDCAITPLEDRLKLTVKALENNPDFSLSRIEIDRPGPHFAIDTVRLLRQKYPQDELYYLMGEDSLRDLPTWHLPIDFVQEVDGIGVMRRPGVVIDQKKLEKSLPGVWRKVFFLHSPLIEISASSIRERIREGKPFRYFVLPTVYDLIVSEKMYQSRE